MSDLISRQAVIKFIREKVNLDLFMKSDIEKADRACMYLCERIYKELPSVQQWVLCSERLPGSEEDVLCDDEGRVTIGYYTDEKIGWHDMHSYRIYPNAWMPMPEAYDPEKEQCANV